MIRQIRLAPSIDHTETCGVTSTMTELDWMKYIKVEADKTRFNNAIGRIGDSPVQIRKDTPNAQKCERDKLSKKAIAFLKKMAEASVINNYL